MLPRFPLLVVTMLAAAALAGCTGDDAGDTPTPATSTPTTSTPSTTTPATSTPIVTPPGTPTPPTPPEDPGSAVNATVERVVVLSAPDLVSAGARAEVCFLVEGSGTIAHVAVHYDEESHPNATSFAEYAGGAAYPGDTAISPVVALPGVFCSNLTAPDEGPLYYRAHALAPSALPGVLSVEKRLDVGPARGVHFLGDLPEVAPPNTNVTACWTAAGASGAVPHTAIHWDDESHPNATFSAYGGGAVYPDNMSTASGNYTLPGSFCANVPTPASGVVYFRAHAMGGENFTAPGEVSAERSIVVAPRVNVVGPVPATAAAGSTVNVCWRVEGEGPTPHTAIHWDTTSHPDAESFSEYAGGALYAGNGEAAAAAQTLPGPFCADLTMPDSGTVYFRAHGVYPGVGLPGELSDEHAIQVE